MWRMRNNASRFLLCVRSLRSAQALIFSAQTRRISLSSNWYCSSQLQGGGRLARRRQLRRATSWRNAAISCKPIGPALRTVCEVT
jgi:hypothetical protein